MAQLDRPLPVLVTCRGMTVFADQLVELLVLWFVWSLSQSSTMTSLAAFAGRAPYWLFAFYGASLVDRFGPFRLLVWCNLAAMLVTLLVAAKLLLLGDDIASYVVLAFAVNATRSVEAAAIAAAVPLLTVGGGMQRANSLFDNAKRAGRIIAPLVTRFVGSIHPTLFFIAAASAYGLMCGGALRAKRVVVVPERQSLPRHSFNTAVSSLWRLRPIRLVIIASAVYAFFHGMAYFVVLPRLSFDQVDAGPFSFGVLVTLFAVGGIASNLAISRFEVRRPELAVAAGMGIAGLCFAAFGTEPNAWFRGVFALLGGASFPLQDVFVTCLIQMHGPVNLVARLHASWRLSCELAIGSGILLGGLIVDLIGPSVVGFASGGAILLVSLLYFVSSGPRTPPQTSST